MTDPNAPSAESNTTDVDGADMGHIALVHDPDATAEAFDTEHEEPIPRTASRVARPDSAQIAKLIEGYDDDFMDDQEGAAELFQDMEVGFQKRSSAGFSGQ